MSQPVKKPWLKKMLLTMIGRPLVKDFNKASRNLKEAQEEILRKVIQSCKNTAFGKDHNFDKIVTIEDYRKYVPIRDFEGHRPYVERMTKGEENVLFPGKPLFYNTTSGTSSKPKLIPVSPEYFKEAYKKISRLWLYTCLRDNPKLFHGKNLSAVAPAEEGRVEDGTPYGSISGVLSRSVPSVLKDVHSAPYGVVCIKDYFKKYYASLRFALANDVAYIICANPSSLLQFHKVVMENYSDLVHDIREGTLRQDVVAELPHEYLDSVILALKPDQERARFLEEIMEEHGDKLRPKHYWPNLVCINTWKQGNCAQVLPKLEGYYPESTAIREFGYQASEGRAGLVLGNDWDYSVLAAHVYHFEFIEESQQDEEKPDVLLAHELEKGKRYKIIITNTSGLYRYDINDIIEVVGFYNQVPLFRFLRKGEGFTSLTGEKLTETQLIDAMDDTCKKQSLQVKHFTLCCDEKNLCYKLFIEFPGDTNKEMKTSFAKELDECLKSINEEYECKRGSDRLAAPLLFELPDNSYELVKSELIERGMAREGQYKVIYLQRKPVVLDILESVAI